MKNKDNNQTSEQYIEQCWGVAQAYLQGVEKGNIVCSRWIKLAVQRHVEDLLRDDLIYDVEKIEKVFKFFYFLRVDKNNRYQRFSLLPYQAFIIMALFGFYRKSTGKRKYRYAFLFMARKNGKTTFASALQLYGLLGDGVVNPQSLLIASTREQASIALTYITGIVNHSPALSKRLEAQRFKIIPRDRNNNAYCKTLASNANKIDGYNASMAILDEVHSYPNDDLYNVIKSSIGARENPLIFLISTAGFSLDSFCYEHTEYCKSILKGDIQDDLTFALLYTMDDEDDIGDSKNWIKANPALGVINHVEDLEDEFNQAQHRGTQLNNFMTKHLNIYTQSEMAWIPDDKLQARCNKINIEELEGMECYAGLDLSSTRDLTSLALVFKKDGILKVLVYVFKAKNAEKNLRMGGIDLQTWISDGHIIECQTETIDYDLIRQTIMDLSEKYSIQIINYDQFNSALIVPKLQEAGIYCENFAQTALKFNEPLKYLEKVIYDEEIDLSDNPAVLWQMRNIVLFIDGNENIKIMKNKSKDSVDIPVSIAMGIAGYIKYNKYDYDQQ